MTVNQGRINQQEEPALALRSDERLNIDLEGEGDQSTKGSSSRLRLENTESAEGASNLRRRRAPEIIDKVIQSMINQNNQQT